MIHSRLHIAGLRSLPDGLVPATASQRRGTYPSAGLAGTGTTALAVAVAVAGLACRPQIAITVL